MLLPPSLSLYIYVCVGMQNQQKRKRKAQKERDTKIGNRSTDDGMFYSHCLLSRKGPLAAIWVAAYFSRKLKKAEVAATDISSSVDKILEDEFDVVTYRVLAYLLLGVVRIYSKKVEYLFDDCNKVLVKIKDFVAHNKYSTVMETMCAPYFSITLPETFELDAFDLEILDDIGGGNVLPHEEITLKDSMWRSGGMGQHYLEKDRCEECASFLDICSTVHNLNYGVISSHLMDSDFELGTSHSVTNLQAKMEKLPSNRLSVNHSMDTELLSKNDEERSDHLKLCSENRQSDGKSVAVAEMVDLDEMHEGVSMQKLWDDSLCQDICLSLKIFDGIREERENRVKQFGENLQTEQQQRKVLDMSQSENEVDQIINADNIPDVVGADHHPSDVEASTEKSQEDRFSDHHQSDVYQTDSQRIMVPNVVQSENEVHRVIKDDHNSRNVEAQTEKLQDTRFSEQESMDIEVLRVAEYPQKHARPLGEEHQSDAENKDISGRTEPQHVAKDSPLVELTPSGNGKRGIVREDFPLSSLDVTPPSKTLDAFGFTTPEFLAAPTPAHEERTRIPRKRKCLFDDVIVFPNYFLRKCIDDSSDIVSKRRKAPHTALAVRRAVRVLGPPHCLLEPLIPCASPVLNPLFFRKKLRITESVESVELPKKFGDKCAMELPKKLRITVGSTEAVEPLLGVDMFEFHSVDRLGVLVEPQEKLNVSDSHNVSQLGGIVEPPGKIDMHESHATGSSLEQMLIAPQTPARNTASLRSFESPVRPEIFTSDIVRPDIETVQKEPSEGKDQEFNLDLTNKVKRVHEELSPNRDQEFNLNLANEEINSCEEDEQDHNGLSERIRSVLRCLDRSFLSQKEEGEEETVNLMRILEGRTKKESARFFYDILVLKSKGCLQVKQETAYGDILVRKSSDWD